ncbi:MAG: SAM-dependent DNA methyltransferase [Desulfamplus sp.]|nr:SAM-dependent DNA methyltransferase [Desulfamplus sp.]
MITGQLKSKIDQLWTAFWTGGITNPLTVIEQISYLMFARMLDITETRNEAKAKKIGKGGDLIFPEDMQHVRWSSFKHKGAEERYKIIRVDLFDFIKARFGKDLSTGEYKSTVGRFMQDAQCMVPNANLMSKAINLIDELPLTRGDIKGDLYEYMLSKLTTAGVQGQFRTPRHIIRAMVEMLDPQATDRICDPACGTAGFLVSCMEYLTEKYSSKNLIEDAKDEEGKLIKDERGNQVKIYPGDKLVEYRKHIQNDMFYGFDFDTTMLRIAAMNLMLHSIDKPQINYQDTLSASFMEGKYSAVADGHFDIILANPPFKGTLDETDVDKSLVSKVKTKKTELLFVILMLRLLKPGGKCAVIVPDGVLFGSSQAHVGLRHMLVEENQLEAVVSLPSGVFKPYAGVSTAVLVFTKGGETKDVWYYDVQADGMSLDDKRDLIEDNDLPDLLAKWKKRNPKKDNDKSSKAFFVGKNEIVENKYDLSINRYKEVKYEEVKYEKPTVILDKLIKLEDEIQAELKELRGMVK